MTVSFRAASIATAAVVCLLLASACDGPGAPQGPPARVLLLTVDTLRADHVSGAGHPEPTMPFVDSHVTGKMSVTAFTAEPTMPCCS